MTVHYQKVGIATFDVPPEKIFGYMSAGDHPHRAFKRHELKEIEGNEVTVEAEIFNPDGTTFTTTIKHQLNRPSTIETTMIGGGFDGATFTHSYTPMGDQTRIDLEGEFPEMPGMSEADELMMIDGFFNMTYAEDAETIKTWSPAAGH